LATISSPSLSENRIYYRRTNGELILNHKTIVPCRESDTKGVLKLSLRPGLSRESRWSPLVTSLFGMKFETLVETDDCVESQLIDSAGETHVVKSKYAIGCGGAGSRVRRIGGNLIGRPASSIYSAQEENIRWSTSRMPVFTHDALSRRPKA